MSYDIKDFLKKFFSSRLFVLAAVFIVFFGIILARIFTLQVVNGKSYQENFSLKIQMKQPINPARGNIYDKNGKLLAYNELAYSISINDSTTYSSTKEKNKAVNAELAEILTVLKNNGETLNNDFKIDRKKDGTYSFNVSGSSLNRFRADVFGKSSADDLKYDKDTRIDEANATAEQIMEYLMGKDNFGISSKYDGDLAYRIVVVRYAMLGNRFARYKEVKIAADVSDKTVADRDATLFAHWTPILYPITYVLGGGRNAAENPATYTIEDAVVLLVPVRDGYLFTGWTDVDLSDMVETADTGYIRTPANRPESSSMHGNAPNT